MLCFKKIKREKNKKVKWTHFKMDGAPEPDGALRTVARAKIRHYRQLHINRPEPIAIMPVAVDTAGRIYWIRSPIPSRSHSPIDVCCVIYYHSNVFMVQATRLHPNMR
jgi:hypothetical protein